MTTRALHGTWGSPVTSGLVAAKASLNDVQWAGETLVWHESRGKSNTIYAQSGLDAPRAISGDLAGRGRVGYGGGDFHAQGDTVVFVGRDGRLYRVSAAGGGARAFTPAFGGAASPKISPDGGWVAFVHTYEEVDGLALVDLEGHEWPRKLLFESDFTCDPVWSPDGQNLAVMRWNHPQMPWEGAEIVHITLDAQRMGKDVSVLAGSRSISALQPTFSPDGTRLLVIDDSSGWWHLGVIDLATGERRALTEGDAEWGGPAWVQGLRYAAWMPDGRHILARRNQMATHTLWLIDSETGAARQILADAPYTSYDQIAVRASDGQVACIASSPIIPSEVITFPVTSDTVRVHARTFDSVFGPDTLSQPQAITWEGIDPGQVHGLYYPPASAGFSSDGLPPLIVSMHGGPTSQRSMRFEPDVQYWATRGYAVLLVNFRGSTGYGRQYMQALDGRWGDIDITDAISGADHLGRAGLIDRQKCIIMGGSAGGYAVLQALVSFPGAFKVGVALYGISDQFALVRDTHKFEARYSDSLLGPLPEAIDLYRERSPLFHADRIVDPLLIFQGADDVVVPQNQSDGMVDALRARGVQVEYHVYEGEGHGFRKPETIDHYLKATQSFLERTVIYA